MNNLSKQKNPFQKEIKGSAPRKYSESKICLENRFSEADKTMRIGKYKVLLNEVLGKGYSSCVYRGVEDGKQLKQYAVKSIELKGFNATCLRLFQKEIEIHRALDHQHIVRCYDVYRTKTHIYMIMEYCPHGDLQKYIKTKKKLQQHNILDIFGQIINGYRYLASNSIIHRDLKPANIMRSGKIWKISDFGFATKAQAGFVDQINVGTPMYMPIESLCRSFYSIKTDIFALGIILYQLYHGKTPWVSKSQAQLLRKMQSNKIKIDREIQNKKMKDFVLKSCQMEYQNRLGQDQFMEFCFGESQEEAPLFVHTSNYFSGKQSDAVAANSKLLAEELNLCRCLYLMVQNIESFLLPKDSKSHFMLVLLKLLLRTIKGLDQDRITQRLSHFDQYKNSSEYSRLLEQIKDQSSKYEKSYLEHIKAADIKTIRIVNQWFPQLSKPFQPLQASFAIRLKSYLQNLLKHNCSALDHIISQDNDDPTLPEKIESFRNLIALQRLVQCCSGQLRGQLGWQPVQNYQSTALKKSDYLDMRRQIKYI